MLVGLIALMSPLYVGVLPAFLHPNGDLLQAILSRSFYEYYVVGFLWVFPIAFLVFGLALMAGTILSKWIIIGQVIINTNHTYFMRV